MDGIRGMLLLAERYYSREDGCTRFDAWPGRLFLLPPRFSSIKHQSTLTIPRCRSLTVLPCTALLSLQSSLSRASPPFCLFPELREAAVRD
jgi:hypothetical protein